MKMNINLGFLYQHGADIHIHTVVKRGFFRSENAYDIPSYRYCVTLCIFRDEGRIRGFFERVENEKNRT